MYRFSELRYVAIAVFVSALWLYGGYMSLRAGRRATAYGWISIALLIVVAFGINAVISGEWLNCGSSVIVLAVEIWLVKVLIGNQQGRPVPKQTDSKM
jgi:hypothetical protein